MLTILGLRGRSASRFASLLALGALIALAAGILTPPPPTNAQQPGVPVGLELTLSLVDDSDNVVQAGSTITVRGQVRLEAGPEELSISAGALRLSADQSWEINDRARLGLSDQPLLQTVKQSDEITAYTDTGLTTPLGNGQLLRVLAWDGDTIVARSGSGGSYSASNIYVFRASTGAQVGLIAQTGPLTSSNIPCAFPYPPGTCSRDDDRHWGWGRANDSNTGSAVAVWQEDADTAWLFVGASRHQWYDSGNYVYTHTGALYIYEIDYSGASVAITRRREIRVPSFGELVSKGVVFDRSQDDIARYGAAVAISADGSTLAVGAHRMHDVGAVYVYTRPTGGWGASLGWNDAVRVSPVVIPPWGSHRTANQRPFEPQSSTDGDAATECDAYCRSVSSYVGDVDDMGTVGHADFGASVALSADGSVLAVSAPRKRFASDRTAGSGRFRGGNSLPSHGELLVFLEPSGGWSAVPNYKTGRTEIGYNASAANFDETMHYGTGPNKRVNAPDWTFSFDWSDPQNHWLGERLALSPDGTTLAASDRHNNMVQMFQVSSPSGWAAGPTAPSATLTGAADGGRWGGFGFNVDSGRFALGNPTYSSAGVSNQGRVLLFDRPGDGTWDSATADDAEALLAPSPQVSAYYGRSLVWQLNTGSRALAVGAGEAFSLNSAISNIVGPGRLWTLATPLKCPINERTDADGTTRTSVCTVELGDTTVVIPKGTPEGPFTISGSVTLVYGEDADGQPLSVQRTADLELRIGTVQEVAHVRLDFANDDRGTPNDVTDDRPQPSALSLRGSSTVLRLQILNELEKASAAGSVASVIITATAGTLSTDFGSGCAAGGGAATCRLDASAVGATNADNIPITLTHPGREGTARISVLVIATDGSSHESEQREVVLAGAPRALGVSGPSVALLNIDTPDSGADKDDRDVVTLTVTATDRLGSPVRAADRSYSYRITGPDDKRVAASKIAVQWPIRGGATCTNPPTVTEPRGATRVAYTGEGTTASALSGGQNNVGLCIRDDSSSGGERFLAWETGDADITIAKDAVLWLMWEGLTRSAALTAEGQPQIRLDVNAAASAPLASGEYTLEVRQAALPWTSTTFRLAGAPAAITVSGPDSTPALNERFTLTASIVDADGGAVPDGTPVEWSAVAGGSATLVRVGAELVTKDGEASSTWLAASSGGAFVSVKSGAQQQLHPLTFAAPQVSLVESMSNGAGPGFGIWLGRASVQAADLVAGVEGVDAIHTLRSLPSRWVTYAVDDGVLRYGSVNHEIQPGDIYWVE